MHATFLTSTALALLGLQGALASGQHGNMAKQNHAAFVRVKRGGPTLHLIGDETVGKWTGGSLPQLPVVQATAVASPTTTWNLLDSINAALGAPIGKPTSTSSSSSSSSSSSASSSSSSASPSARAAFAAPESSSSPFPSVSAGAAPSSSSSSSSVSPPQAASSDTSSSSKASLGLGRGRAAAAATASATPSSSGSAPVKRSINEIEGEADRESENEEDPVALRQKKRAATTLALGRGAAKVLVASSSSTEAAAPTQAWSASDYATAQGWGAAFANKYTSMSVVNHGVKGATTRAIVRDLWSGIVSSVKAGDVVVIQLGHKESGMPSSTADIKAGCVASVPGLGGETMTVKGCDGGQEVVQTYGTYIKQMCADVQAKGATCAVASVTPKNEWKRDNTLTYNSPYIGYARSAASAAGAMYIAHEETIAKKLIADGQASTLKYFLEGDTLQPNLAGADVFAATFAAAASCAGVSSITAPLTPAGLALRGQFC